MKSSQTSARAVTFSAHGGLNPVGVVQVVNWRPFTQVLLQKTGVFNLSPMTCVSFVAGAKYYADVNGALTTTKPSEESKSIGVALSNRSLFLTLYN